MTDPTTVEPQIEWQAPSECRPTPGCDSNTYYCVEVAHLDNGDVLVRNPKDPGVPPVRYSEDEWAVFLDAVKAGEFG